MDPLRLTLIIAGTVVLLAIIVFGRKSSKNRDMIYPSSGAKEFSFGSPSEDTLLDEEVIVLPPRKKPAVNTASPTPVSEKKIPDAPEIVVNKNKPEEPQPFGPAVQNEFAEDVKPETPKIKPSVAKKVADPLVTEKTTDAVKSPKAIKESVAVNRSKKIPPIKVEKETVKKADFKPAEKKLAEEKPEEKKAEPVVKKPVQSKERFVVLHVVAAEGNPFTGQSIVESTQTLGMAYGKHSVFHYPVSSAESGNSKFCMVNMTAQGNFDAAEIAALKTDGVSLIMRLPVQGADGLTVFSNMLGVAQALARKLGGDILDQTRVPLTADIVTSLRSDIAHFESEVNQQAAVPEV